MDVSNAECSAQVSRLFKKMTCMNKFSFKTDINYLGCVSQIKPYLDKLEQEGQIRHWQVHPTDPDHTLEIETSHLALEEVQLYVQNAGFKAEPKTRNQKG